MPFAHRGHPERNTHSGKGKHQRRANAPRKLPVPGSGRNRPAIGYNAETKTWTN